MRICFHEKQTMTSQISSSDDDSLGGKTVEVETVSQSKFVEQKALIEKLTSHVKQLEAERDAFKREARLLRQENANLRVMVQSPACKSPTSNSANQSKQSWKLSEQQPMDMSLLHNDNSTITQQRESCCENLPVESTPKRMTCGSTSHIALTSGTSCNQESLCVEPIGNREIATCGESTSYESVEEKRNSAGTSCPSSCCADSPAKSPKKKCQRTPSRHRTIRSDSNATYELSTDLREKNQQCLEKKYGGKSKANHAALVIQQSYRHWVLNRSFLRMRANTCSARKRSITMPEKHFEKLKKTSLVFYGPENPVMIVDEENKFHTKKDRTEGKLNKFHINKDSNESKLQQAFTRIPTIPVSDCKLDCLIESAEDMDVVDKKLNLVDSAEDMVAVDKKLHFVNESICIDNDNSAFEDILIKEIPSGEKVVDEEINVFDHADDKSNTKWPVSHNTSDSSSSNIDSQYDIIDDAQVLTVVGKEVDILSGSRVSVDTIHDDTPDGICFSAEKLYLDDTSQQYEPTFDKSMHKRQFRIGVNLFNWKPAIGIDYLVDNEHLADDVKSIAEFLRKETTISKQKISEYFSNIRNEFSMKVLLEFAKSFEFANKGVDEALRQFQSYFKLTGEAQTVEKFLQVFSDRYVECNPNGVSNNADTILLLAFALAMLNTDLHNQNVKRRMTHEEFLRNLRGTYDGNDFNQQMLTDMYSRIHKNEFATGADHTTQLHQIENSFVGKIPNLAATHRQFVKLFTLEEVIDPNRKDKPHNRLAFLFNDLLILAKPRGKSGVHGSGHIFSCKASYSLLGKKVAEFSNEHYPSGVLLLQKIDEKGIATFSMKDEATKKSFVEELDEYIRETNGMENIRIALSKTNQLAFQNRRKGATNRCKSLFLSKNSLNSEDSGFHGMDKTETASLMDLRIGNSLEAEDAQSRSNSATIVASSSMNDINEGESEDDNYEKLVRTNSSSSLDPAVLSDSNSNTSGESTNQQSISMARPAHTGRKTLFGQLGSKWRKPMSQSVLGSSEKKLMVIFQEKHASIPSTIAQPVPP